MGHRLRANYALITRKLYSCLYVQGMNPQLSRLLPAGPMARYLRVPVRWLRAEAEEGRIPHLKAGDQYLFDAKAVEDALIDRAREREGGDA